MNFSSILTKLQRHANCFFSFVSQPANMLPFFFLSFFPLVCLVLMKKVSGGCLTCIDQSRIIMSWETSGRADSWLNLFTQTLNNHFKEEHFILWTTPKSFEQNFHIPRGQFYKDFYTFGQMYKCILKPGNHMLTQTHFRSLCVNP